MHVCVVIIQPEGSQSCADGLDSVMCVADVGTATRLKCSILTYQTMHDTILYASSTRCYMLTAFIISLALCISELLLSRFFAHSISSSLSLSFPSFSTLPDALYKKTKHRAGYFQQASNTHPCRSRSITLFLDDFLLWFIKSGTCMALLIITTANEQ